MYMMLFVLLHSGPKESMLDLTQVCEKTNLNHISLNNKSNFSDFLIIILQVDSLKETRNQYIKLLMEQYVFQMNPVSTEYGLLFTQGGVGTLS